MSLNPSNEHPDQVPEAVSSKEKDNKVEQLAQMAKRAVNEELKGNPLKQLVELVKSANWAGATELLQNNFQGTSSRSVAIKEILVLICVSNNMRFVKNAFDWVMKSLEAEQQPEACEALYQLIKSEHDSETPLVLMLFQFVKECLIGVQDNVRTELEEDSNRLIDVIVEGIKMEAFGLCNDITLVGALEYFIPTIVSKFDVDDLDSVQLLIELSENAFQNKDLKVSLCIISTLLKEFEENSLLLDSEQALHLLVHVISVQIRWKWCHVDWKENVSMLQALQDKLKPNFFLQFQRYVEDHDVQEFEELLYEHDWKFRSLVPEFVSLYFNGQSERTHRLFEVARNNPERHFSRFILERLHTKMVVQEKNHTFDAFVLYSLFRRLNVPLHDLYKKYDGTMSTSLYTAPSCVLLLHSPSYKEKLRLVNKRFALPLCVQDETVLCCDSQVQIVISN